MGANNGIQAHVVSGAALRPGQSTLELSLFNPDGTPFNAGGSPTPDATTTTKGKVLRSAGIGAITVADATDLASAIALANANKTKINELITKLDAAGSVTKA